MVDPSGPWQDIEGEPATTAAPNLVLPPPPPNSRPRPRLWTQFLLFFLTLFAGVAGQGVLIGGLAALRLSRGETIEEVQKRPFGDMSAQLGLMVAYAPMALGLIAAAVIPALISRRPLMQRLGLGAAAMPWWGYPLLVGASGIPFAVAIGAAILGSKISPAQPEILELWKPGPPLLAVAYVLFIGLVPGFCEELFYRGGIQRRFQQRWSPWTSILVCSALFALVHIVPSAIALAFPLGIWLGVLAWRTGSIWPSIVCHAAINSGWNALQILSHDPTVTEPSWEDLSTADWAITGAVGVVALICFVFAIRLLARAPAPAPPVDSPPLPPSPPQPAPSPLTT